LKVFVLESPNRLHKQDLKANGLTYQIEKKSGENLWHEYDFSDGVKVFFTTEVIALIEKSEIGIDRLRKLVEHDLEIISRSSHGERSIDPEKNDELNNSDKELNLLRESLTSVLGLGRVLVKGVFSEFAENLEGQFKKMTLLRDQAAQKFTLEQKQLLGFAKVYGAIIDSRSGVGRQYLLMELVQGERLKKNSRVPAELMDAFDLSKYKSDFIMDWKYFSDWFQNQEMKVDDLYPRNVLKTMGQSVGMPKYVVIDQGGTSQD
jgi:hypothetical protein